MAVPNPTPAAAAQLFFLPEDFPYFAHGMAVRLVGRVCAAPTAAAGGGGGAVKRPREGGDGEAPEPDAASWAELALGALRSDCHDSGAGAGGAPGDADTDADVAAGAKHEECVLVMIPQALLAALPELTPGMGAAVVGSLVDGGGAALPRWELREVEFVLPLASAESVSLLRRVTLARRRVLERCPRLCVAE